MKDRRKGDTGEEAVCICVCVGCLGGVVVLER